MGLLGHFAAEVFQQGRRFHRKHPALTQAAGAVGALATLRIVTFLAWWLFFSPAPLQPISGILSCDGVAIQEGTVSLEPVDVRGVASRTAHVVDGMFSLNARNGVARGVEYLVRVEGFRKTGKVFPGVKPGEFSEEYEQFVLPEYNKGSRLRLHITRELIDQGVAIDVRGVAPWGPDREN